MKYFFILLISIGFTASASDWANTSPCNSGDRYDEASNSCVNILSFQSYCPEGSVYIQTTGPLGEDISRCMPNGSSRSAASDGESNADGSNTADDNVASNENSSAAGDEDPKKAEQNKVAAYEQCKASYTKAKRACNGTNYLSSLGPIVQQFTQLKSMGSIKEACQAAQEVSQISMGLNLGFGVSCLTFARSCANQCKTATRPNSQILVKYAGEEHASAMASKCESFKQNEAVAGLIQSASDAANFAMSKDCAKMADAKCVGENAMNDSDCQQFCFQPGRADHPKCASAIANCSNPAFAQQNSQMCMCMQNPFAQGCSAVQAPMPFTNGGGDPFANINNNGLDNFGSDENDFLGLNSQNKNNVSEPGSPGGGNGFGGGAGGSMALDGGTPQDMDDPIDKDILTGQGGGGSAGGFFGYGGGGSGSSAGSSGGSGGRPSDDGIDLRAFLPGGKKDPSRGLASATGATGITRADGLTNFQKVTRKINQKLSQGELHP